MKLKNIKYIGVFAFSVLMMASCNKFLDQVPDTRVDLKQDLNSLRLLLVEAYPAYNYAVVGELSSDNVIDNNSPNENGMRYNFQPNFGYRISDQLYAFEDANANLSGTGDTPSDIWQGFYHAMAVCNAVLKNIEELRADGVENELFDPMIGEAKIARAYSGFMLANIFCMPWRGPELSKNIPGIPYPTEPETLVKVNYDRGTLADTYAAIEKDIEEGLPLIDDAIYEQPKYHFNKAAANAFAAKFYLFKREYDKCEQYADAALGGKGQPTYSDMWLKISEGKFYYMSDFALYRVDIAHADNIMLTTNYSCLVRFLGGAYRYLCSRDAKRATIQGPGPSWANCRWKSSATGEVFTMHPAFNGCTFVSGGNSEYGVLTGTNCFELFEYTNKVAGIGYPHYVRPTFTTNETALVRAEARLFLGNRAGCFEDLKGWCDSHYVTTDDRLEYLNESHITKFYDWNKDPGYGIMKEFHIDEVCPSDKYHLTADMEPYMQCVQHFRRMETVHMGDRFFDIKRFGFSITHKIGLDGEATLQVLDPRYAIQIPSEVLSAGLQPNDRKVPEVKSMGEIAVSTQYEKAN